MDASAGLPLRVPVGREAARWGTFRSVRTLVAAARTVTSTARLLEALPPLLRGDSRVTMLFAYDPTSAFSGGVLDLLRDAGCRTVPWAQLADIRPDLLISASENIEVPEGDWPVLVLPHGVGFQKMVPDSRTDQARLSGVVPDALLESGRAWLAVSHPDQEEQLLAARPKAAGRTLLIGDPVLDELRASTGRYATYRASLGVPVDQRLVVLSSTWGPTSLLGTHHDLPVRLLAALPYDEYRVAAIIHPNVWAGHGAWQIRTLLADALDAGLLLIPPVHAWRPALVAADAVLGDHGSVTLYGAALGKPLLLGAFGADSVPGTAMSHLGRTAPRLDPQGDPHAQIEAAVAAQSPDGLPDVAPGAFAHPGQALVRLRTAVYDLLRLPEPDRASPPVLTLPGPEFQHPAVTSWSVATDLSPGDGRPTVTVRRYPAVAVGDGDRPNDGPGQFTHLACDDDEREARISESAAVLFRRQHTAATVTGLRWIADTLRRFPGSYLAATGLIAGGYLVGLRDGRVIEVSVTGPTKDAGLPAALVYTCLRARLPLDDMDVTLRVGAAAETHATLRLRAAPRT